MSEQVQSSGEVYDPASKPAKVQFEQRNVQVRRTYKEAGVLKSEETDESDLIDLELPATEAVLAEVGAASRMTVNLGNFESVQIEVAVKLPCYLEELDECYRTAKCFVDSRLNKEVKAIREYRDSKKGS